MLPHAWVATFFIHAAGILWGNMMGQGEERRGGQPSPKCSGHAFRALRWLHSGRYKLTGIGSGSHANEVIVGSSVAFCSSESTENVGVHVKTALWGSSDMWGCLAQAQHIITQSVWQRYRANLYVTVPEQLLYCTEHKQGFHQPLAACRLSCVSCFSAEQILAVVMARKTFFCIRNCLSLNCLLVFQGYSWTIGVFVKNVPFYRFFPLKHRCIQEIMLWIVFRRAVGKQELIFQWLLPSWLKS